MILCVSTIQPNKNQKSSVLMITEISSPDNQRVERFSLNERRWEWLLQIWARVAQLQETAKTQAENLVMAGGSKHGYIGGHRRPRSADLTCPILFMKGANT